MRIVLLLFVLYVASQAGVQADTGIESIKDIQYAQACGPLAAFAALNALGIPADLDSLARSCEWSVGKPVSMSHVFRAIEETGYVDLFVRRLSPEDLAELIVHDEMVAILPVRKDGESINHAICIFDADDTKLVGIDYPKLRVEYTPIELGGIWDGEALLLKRRIPIWHRALEVLPGVIVGFGIVFGRNFIVRRVTRDKQ